MEIVKKQWGHEQWIELNEHYCFKRIFFKAGKRCSLQYHEVKEETIYVESGEGYMWIELSVLNPRRSELHSLSIDNRDICYWRDTKEHWYRIYKIPISSGFSITIPKGTVHRIEATTDLTTLEVSTPEVDDCIRIEDDYKRPDGRIDSEHTK